MKKIVSVLTWCSGIIVFILLTGSIEALERMPVERLDLQAKLLRAVLKFSSRQLDQLVVGVIYVEEAKEIAQNFAAELEKLTHNDQPIQVVFIAANTLDSVTDSVNIVYVTPGNEAFLNAIAELTAWLEHQALEDLKREALITADFLSDAVSASVDLEDGDSVKRALESATRRENIVFMQVYNTNEELLTAYQTERARILHFPKQTDRSQSFGPKNGIVVALHPIPSPINNDVSIGTFVLGISTEALEERTRQFRIAGFGISIILFVVGNVIAWIIGIKIAEPVMRLSGIARQIASGDLAQTATLDTKSSDEIGELAQSFDYMRESLQHIIGHIRHAGLMMQSSTDDIFTAINQLAAALEQQSASVLETTTTMESITTTSRQISGNTDAVVRMAEQTKTLSQKGVAVAEETIQKMQAIHDTNTEVLQKITTLGERSETIGDVIQIIHDIADRTKLIAFNAALEAVGAKDVSGKRFNVVAVEIRRLADTIIESTQEIETNVLEIQQWIRELVSSSGITTKRISEGVHHTETTADWLQEILEAAIHTTDEAKQISLAIQEQQTANEQILLALKEISDGAKQFVNAGNQVSKSADEMKSLAEEFRVLINKFELDTNPKD